MDVPAKWTSVPEYNGAVEAFIKRLGFLSLMNILVPQSFPARTAEENRALSDKIDAHMPFIESPIEATMLVEILFITDKVYMNESLHKWGPSPTFTLTTQAKIEQYRVDFLLQLHHLGQTRNIVIECDGHDYHERTKEQAARDRSRDRELSTMGYSVLRFTGSEIYRDSFRCGQSVQDFLESQVMSIIGAANGANQNDKA